MGRSISGNRTARYLQASVLIGLAVVLIAMLVQRGGSSEDIAAHFAGPGNFPLTTPPPQFLTALLPLRGNDMLKGAALLLGFQLAGEAVLERTRD